MVGKPWLRPLCIDSDLDPVQFLPSMDPPTCGGVLYLQVLPSQAKLHQLQKRSYHSASPSTVELGPKNAFLAGKKSPIRKRSCITCIWAHHHNATSNAWSVSIQHQWTTSVS